MVETETDPNVIIPMPSMYDILTYLSTVNELHLIMGGLHLIVGALSALYNFYIFEDIVEDCCTCFGFL